MICWAISCCKLKCNGIFTEFELTPDRQ